MTKCDFGGCGGCSCHMSPPCTHCIDHICEHGAICEACQKEKDEYKPPQKLTTETVNPHAKYFKTREEKLKGCKEIRDTKGTISWTDMPHTHFSMIKLGYAPIGMGQSEILPSVEGTFGGRFQKFDSRTGYFEYIAYTD